MIDDAWSPPRTPTGANGSSHVRYGVVAFSVTMAMLLYLTRFAIGPATDTMIGELEVSRERFGFAIGMFFFAYAVLQVPAGYLVDALGVRRPLALYVLAWSVATILLGFAHSLVAIVAVRLVLGIAQAGAYPAAAACVRAWLPLSERGRANSLTATGGRAGGLLAFALTPVLMGLAGGALGWSSGTWRPVFVGYGVLGVVWSIAFFFWYRDSPEADDRVSEGERQRILAGRTSGTAMSSWHFPWRALLTSRNLWLLAGINFFLNVGWIFLATWLPSYLRQFHGEALEANFGSAETAAGLLTAATALAGMAGNLTGGWWTDRLVRRVGLTWARRLPGIASSVAAACLYLAATGTEHLALLVAEMAAIYFCADLAIGAIWATYQDIGGVNTASVLGFANMCGNLGAAGCAWAIGYLADQDQWLLVFAVSAASFLMCAVGWLGVDARRPIRKVETPDEEERESAEATAESTGRMTTREGGRG